MSVRPFRRSGRRPTAPTSNESTTETGFRSFQTSTSFFAPWASSRAGEEKPRPREEGDRTPPQEDAVHRAPEKGERPQPKEEKAPSREETERPHLRLVTPSPEPAGTAAAEPAAPLEERAEPGPKPRVRVRRWPFSKPSVGLYEEGDVMHVVRANKTFSGGVRWAGARVPLPGTASDRKDGSWCAEWTPHLSPAVVKTLTVALRAEVVGFVCRPADEQSAREPAEQFFGAVTDRMRVSTAKKKLQLQATVRRDEIDAMGPIAFMDAPRPPRCEPAPWAAWRASMYYARPAKPARGVQLRFLLGQGKGIAILSSGDKPLGWQLLSWSGSVTVETLFQSFRLLSVFTERRLGLGAIARVSVQGTSPEADWTELSEAIGRPVDRVPGPPLDGRMVAFGAALGGLDSRRESLNLARSLQKQPSITTLIPWGEALYALGLIFVLFMTLEYRAQELRARISTQKLKNAQVIWSQGMTTPAVKSERDKLKAALPGPVAFLKTDVRFSELLAEMPSLLPSTTWLRSLDAADDIWIEKPDKRKGRKYVLIEASSPFARPGDVDETLHAVQRSAFLARSFPTTKVVELASQGQADAGETSYALLCLPKEGIVAAEAAAAKPAESKDKGHK